MGEPRPELGHPDMQTKYTEAGRGSGKDKQRQGCVCITLQGAEILMALQAGFSSVINSHSIGSVPTGRTATINMSHSINWCTMGIVQTSALRTHWRTHHPIQGAIDGFCCHCTWGPSNHHRWRKGRVDPWSSSLYHSTSILSTCSTPRRQGRRVGAGETLSCPQRACSLRERQRAT